MKIGLAIVTYNRPHYFTQCLEAVGLNRRDLSHIVVVNDGTPYTGVSVPEWVNEHIQLGHNKSVGVAKNVAMRALLHAGMDHIFIMEDDMILKSPDIFRKYVETATSSGVFHLNYALHGPANKKPNSEIPNPRQIVDYGDVKLVLYPHCVGAFSYFHKGVILNVGYHDERFKNAWEHVEYALRVIKKGLHPPFWWFADIENSSDYITEIPGSIGGGSSINHTPEWTSNMKRGAAWFKEKHGHIPVQLPDTPPEEVQNILTRIEQYYGTAKGTINAEKEVQAERTDSDPTSAN
jgi:GT2 family glycosyltransferase